MGTQTPKPDTLYLENVAAGSHKKNSTDTEEVGLSKRLHGVGAVDNVK